MRHEKEKKTSSDCSVSNGYFIKNDKDDDEKKNTMNGLEISAISQVYMIPFGFFLWNETLFFSITLSLGRDFYHKNQSRKQTTSGGSREKFYINRQFDGS